MNLVSVVWSMMTREQRAGLARLMLRWPEGRSELRLKGASDDILLDLCEDYDLARAPPLTDRNPARQERQKSLMNTACRLPSWSLRRARKRVASRITVTPA